jgi:hypothetical protein
MAGASGFTTKFQDRLFRKWAITDYQKMSALVAATVQFASLKLLTSQQSCCSHMQMTLLTSDVS